MYSFLRDLPGSSNSQSKTDQEADSPRCDEQLNDLVHRAIRTKNSTIKPIPPAVTITTATAESISNISADPP